MESRAVERTEIIRICPARCRLMAMMHELLTLLFNYISARPYEFTVQFGPRLPGHSADRRLTKRAMALQAGPSQYSLGNATKNTPQIHPR